ncbi:putative glutaminase [Fulvia fulva]|uniref:Glutaminase n=1 Tax=Passalora fulva TaxID=5499 RepID=A0A9Q8L7M8_PASFU|nr:putative glutaminase [Fulvia fulva]KAK4634437.1 putative glutaminase [Fulvia fulva]KAK4636501.1 putative glutaminase [Fulvia fulva]UJO12310.1 putative glutaminase [Fulvia fulva]WPV09563.1 putative glutaminase [Fulvia fulva]WPV24958.1 putative glutaminase [Fulvia fulva]
MRAGAVVAAAAGLLSFSSASTLTPPVLPLIVRNPYLSTWLANARDEPWSKWPMHWTGQSVGLSILASVPETSNVYPLLGRPHDGLDRDSNHYTVAFPQYLGAQYDASTTNLTYAIPSYKTANGSVEIVLSFLSPITPTSTLRQSIPASYLSVHVKGNFNVDIYVDVNGQWVSGNRGSRIEWDLHDSEKKLKTWRIKRSNEELFTEWNDRAEWGSLHFTGPADIHHECGVSNLLRQRFSRTGSLQNAVDDSYRSIMDEEPVFAFSKSFNLSGGCTDEYVEDSVLFTIAHIQDPVTQFASARGLTMMRPLWKSYFFTNDALTSFHYHDYKHAFTLAADYSAKVAKDAYASGSDSYKDIVELSARQVLGGTVFSGTPDNPILFLKEISSDGNCQTIDVIFPAFPFFLYTNPKWLAYMLEPLLEHMLSGQYPNDYAMHDLGASFPNVTGHPDGRDEYMPVEECGDMLIMGLALVNSLKYDSQEQAQSPWSALGKPKDVASIEASDSVSPFSLPAVLETREGIYGLDDQWGGVASKHQAEKWVSRTYSLWKQWTGYLVEFSLYPENQLCTDDFAGWLPLMTNLALKGIVGIKAMSELAELVGEKEDAKHYRNISESYIKTWEKEGIAHDGGRAKLAYNWQGSWTTIYSLYADALLCFHPSLNASSSDLDMHRAGTQEPLMPHSKDASNFIPDHIYTTQSRWYEVAMQKYGLPLDSRHFYTKSDWEFQAAAVSSKKVRAQILDRVAKWLNETSTDRPFTDLYKTEDDGGYPGPNFFARPVIGSHFAFLTLERACGGKGSQAFMYES